MKIKKNDIHIVRYFTSTITISNGKVKNITTPIVSACPLAATLYPGLEDSENLSRAKLKAVIKDTINNKIARFGFFTKNRKLIHDGAAIPYGASEIIAHGLKNKAIDCSVLVCDGAGTVITESPDLTQGIGARMNSVLKTSAIPEVMKRLRQYGGHIINNDGTIDQKMGVVEAAKKGYKKIAVTINAYKGERLKNIRDLEDQYGISVIILVVCTTGITKKRMKEIEKYTDIVWACHSKDLKNRLDKYAIKKLSNVSPVYVLTKRGLTLTSNHSPNIYKMRKEIKKAS